MKSIDFKYADLLVKLYLDLVKNGHINHIWTINEIRKLQNLEGTIEDLTFRLSKTRFWNYVSNKTQWFKDNSQIVVLAKETENLLSKALHDSLTREFVDNKLKVLIRDININKPLKVSINAKREIILNNKIIGKIFGFEAKLFDKESYVKNKTVLDRINVKVAEAINKHIVFILKDPNFNISIHNNFDVLYKDYKIASIYRGENLLSPELLISSNQFIDKENYSILKNKIKLKINDIISSAFWEKAFYNSIKKNHLKAIVFSLHENLGIVKIYDYFTLSIIYLLKRIGPLLKNK